MIETLTALTIFSIALPLWWVVGSIVVSIYASRRTRWWAALIISLLFSPILGALVCLMDNTAMHER